MRPDLGDLGLCGILNTYEQLVALRYQENPVVSIWEEKSKVEWIDGVKDDEVVSYLDDRATWHISRDRACTWIEVTQLSSVCG